MPEQSYISREPSETPGYARQPICLRCLTAPSTLKGGAAQKVAAKLLTAGLVREIKAKAGMEVWRRDLETGQAYSLKLTDAGLQAIAGDECSAQSMPSTGVPNTNDGASEAKTGANVTAAESATTPQAAVAVWRATKVCRNRAGACIWRCVGEFERFP